jgi:hypothetical protein
VDNGSIVTTWKTGSGTPGSNTRTFDNEEHDPGCGSYTDGPGPQLTLSPWSGSIKGDITYNLTVTVTCQGITGSLSDSDTLTGKFNFNVALP